MVKLDDVRLDDGSVKRDYGFQNPELEDLGTALRNAIKKAERVLLEAQNSMPSVTLSPEDRENLDDWTYATVTLPAVHVRGRFVLWQKGRPAHLVYPTLARYMTHFPIRQLVSHHMLQSLPREVSAPEAASGPTVLLVVEVDSVQASGVRV